MTDPKEGTQLGIRIDGWHWQRLQILAEESRLTPTTVGRDLLLAAIEQASDSEPFRPSHLQKFDRGRRSS